MTSLHTIMQILQYIIEMGCALTKTAEFLLGDVRFPAECEVRVWLFGRMGIYEHTKKNSSSTPFKCATASFPPPTVLIIMSWWCPARHTQIFKIGEGMKVIIHFGQTMLRNTYRMIWILPSKRCRSARKYCTKEWWTRTPQLEPFLWILIERNE
jgi:hypothetical protein